MAKPEDIASVIKVFRVTYVASGSWSKPAIVSETDLLKFILDRCLSPTTFATEYLGDMAK